LVAQEDPKQPEQSAPAAVASGKGTLSADLTVSPAEDNACWKVLPDEDGGDNLGPFTTGELENQYRMGIVTGESLVWREGMQSWMSMRGVAELQHIVGPPVDEVGGVAGALAEAAVKPGENAPLHTLTTEDETPDDAQDDDDGPPETPPAE
jgi:hypothetical protein